MGLPAWLWFVIAAVCALAGGYLLFRGRFTQHSVEHERQRWANLRGWHYVEEDPQLLQMWEGGAIGYFGGQYAVDVVAGSTFTSDGRRPVYVFDLETEGVVDVAVAAVRCRREAAALIELWLPTVPFQRDQMPDLLGPVGQRYAFVSDVNTARAMITRDLVDAVDEIGDDVTVVWLEGDWVLGAVAPESNPARLERLLRDLGEVADLVDPFETQQEPGRHADYQKADYQRTQYQPATYASEQAGPPTGPPPLPQPDPPTALAHEEDDEPDPPSAQPDPPSWSSRSYQRWSDPESGSAASSSSSDALPGGRWSTARESHDSGRAGDTDDDTDDRPLPDSDRASAFAARPAPWQSAWRSTGKATATRDGFSAVHTESAQPPEREPTSQAVHPGRDNGDRDHTAATRTGLVHADVEDDYEDQIAEIDPTHHMEDDVPSPRPAGEATDEADERGGARRG